MREIEFRGLDRSGVMRFGSLVVTNHFVPHKPKQHTKHWIVESAFGNGGWFNIRGRVNVISETVCQYTGLKDCNGVKIFEGDLLHCLDPIEFKPKTVSFIDGSFVIDAGERWQISLHQEYINENELVLIGNIHQHPHLLNGGAE